MSKIGIIDYGAGNVRSVQFALQRLRYDAILSDDPKVLTECDKLIFPGVGHARPAMERLTVQGLDVFIREWKKPLLGICLGMQLLCKYSEEGETNCIGVFDAEVKKFDDVSIKIPQVGWNTIIDLKSDLFKGIKEEAYMYFVHSYYVPMNANAIATCNYGLPFAAALQKDNFYAVQFHPEKSGSGGERVILNFLSL